MLLSSRPKSSRLGLLSKVFLIFGVSCLVLVLWSLANNQSPDQTNIHLSHITPPDPVNRACPVGWTYVSHSGPPVGGAPAHCTPDETTSIGCAAAHKIWQAVGSQCLTVSACDDLSDYMVSGTQCIKTPQADCEDNAPNHPNGSIWLGGACRTPSGASNYCSTSLHQTYVSGSSCSNICVSGYEWTGPRTGGGCTRIVQSPQADCEDNAPNHPNGSIWLGGACRTPSGASNYCSTSLHQTYVSGSSCSNICVSGYEWTGPRTGGGCTRIVQSPQADCEDNAPNHPNGSIWLGGACRTPSGASNYCSTSLHQTYVSGSSCSNICVSGYEWTGPRTGGGCTRIVQSPQADCEDNAPNHPNGSIWLGGACRTPSGASNYCSTSLHQTYVSGSSCSNICVSGYEWTGPRTGGGCTRIVQSPQADCEDNAPNHPNGSIWLGGACRTPSGASNYCSTSLHQTYVSGSSCSNICVSGYEWTGPRTGGGCTRIVQSPQADCEDNAPNHPNGSIWLGGACRTPSGASNYCSTSLHQTYVSGSSCSNICVSGYEWTGPRTGGGCTRIVQSPQADCEDNAPNHPNGSIWLGGACRTPSGASNYCSTSLHQTYVSGSSCSNICVSGYEWTGPRTGGGCTRIVQSPQADCEDNAPNHPNGSIWLGGACRTPSGASNYCSTSLHQTYVSGSSCSNICVSGYEWTGPRTGGGCTALEADCEVQGLISDNSGNCIDPGTGEAVVGRQPGFNSLTDFVPDANGMRYGQPLPGYSHGGDESDFLRLGAGGSRGNSVTACEAMQTVTFWVYIHNSQPARLNGPAFEGSVVAHNANLKLQFPAPTTFAQRHTITAVVEADETSPISGTVTVSCADHQIALSLVGNSLSYIKGIPTSDTSSKDGQLNSPYKVWGDPTAAEGAGIGFAGGLFPASRHYTLRVTIQAKVIVMEDPPPEDEVTAVIQASPSCSQITGTLAITGTHNEPLNLELRAGATPQQVTLIDSGTDGQYSFTIDYPSTWWDTSVKLVLVSPGDGATTKTLALPTDCPPPEDEITAVIQASPSCSQITGTLAITGTHNEPLNLELRAGATPQQVTLIDSGTDGQYSFTIDYPSTWWDTSVEFVLVSPGDGATTKILVLPTDCNPAPDVEPIDSSITVRCHYMLVLFEMPAGYTGTPKLKFYSLDANDSPRTYTKTAKLTSNNKYQVSFWQPNSWKQNDGERSVEVSYINTSGTAELLDTVQIPIFCDGGGGGTTPRPPAAPTGDASANCTGITGKLVIPGGYSGSPRIKLHAPVRDNTKQVEATRVANEAHSYSFSLAYPADWRDNDTTTVTVILVRSGTDLTLDTVVLPSWNLRCQTQPPGDPTGDASANCTGITGKLVIPGGYSGSPRIKLHAPVRDNTKQVEATRVANEAHSYSFSLAYPADWRDNDTTTVTVILVRSGTDLTLDTVVLPSWNLRCQTQPPGDPTGDASANCTGITGKLVIPGGYSGSPRIKLHAPVRDNTKQVEATRVANEAHSYSFSLAYPADWRDNDTTTVTVILVRSGTDLTLDTVVLPSWNLRCQTQPPGDPTGDASANCTGITGKLVIPGGYSGSPRIKLHAPVRDNTKQVEATRVANEAHSYSFSLAYPADWRDNDTTTVTVILVRSGTDLTLDTVVLPSWNLRCQTQPPGDPTGDASANCTGITGKLVIPGGYSGSPRIKLHAPVRDNTKQVEATRVANEAHSYSFSLAYPADWRDNDTTTVEVLLVIDNQERALALVELPAWQADCREKPELPNTGDNPMLLVSLQVAAVATVADMSVRRWRHRGRR